MRPAPPQSSTREQQEEGDGRTKIGLSVENVLLWRMLAWRGGTEPTSFADCENLFSWFVKPLLNRPYFGFLLVEPSDPILKLNTGIGRCRQ